MTIISTVVLKAALTHAPKKEARYYLNGVLIDRSSGHVVATDGHRLLAAKIEAGCWTRGASYIIPRDVCEAAVKMAGKSKTMVLNDTAHSIAGIAFTPIDGRYPDWQRIVPREVSGEPTLCNPEYLATAYKALAMIAGGSPETCDFSPNGPHTAAVVTRSGVDAFVVVMPMRSENVVGESFTNLMRDLMIPSVCAESAELEQVA